MNETTPFDSARIKTEFRRRVIGMLKLMGMILAPFILAMATEHLPFVGPAAQVLGRMEVVILASAAFWGCLVWKLRCPNCNCFLIFRLPRLLFGPKCPCCGVDLR